MIALRPVVFVLGAAWLAWLSRAALLRPRSHGFTRFFAWVCMLALILLNLPVWHADPFRPRQLVSWVLLLASIGYAIEGFRLLRLVGKPAAARDEAGLFGFEKTTALVTTGLYRRVRHPLYAALLFLAWGAFLKDPSSLPGAVLVAIASLCLFLTAKRDEAECIGYFGPAYRDYMARTRNFIPFLF